MDGARVVAVTGRRKDFVDLTSGKICTGSSGQVMKENKRDGIGRSIAGGGGENGADLFPGGFTCVLRIF